MKLHFINTPTQKNEECTIKNILARNKRFPSIGRYPLSIFIDNTFNKVTSKAWWCLFYIQHLRMNEKNQQICLEKQLILQGKASVLERFLRMPYACTFYSQDKIFHEKLSYQTYRKLNNYTHQYRHFYLEKGIWYI